MLCTAFSQGPAYSCTPDFKAHLAIRPLMAWSVIPLPTRGPFPNSEILPDKNLYRPLLLSRVSIAFLATSTSSRKK
jgi:hypothetical protein